MKSPNLALITPSGRFFYHYCVPSFAAMMLMWCDIQPRDPIRKRGRRGFFLGPARKHGRAGIGSIINISSGAGLVGQSWAAEYNASKAAVHLLAKSTAMQYAREGIRTNSVHPGAIDTRMLAGSSDLIGDSEAFNRPMGRMGTPGRDRLRRGISGFRRIKFMTGTELVIDGGKLSGQWRLADTPYGMQG